MNATAAVGLAVLGFLWLLFLFLTFMGEDRPRLLSLFFFLLWIGTSVILGFFFLVNVFNWDPNPLRVDIARWSTDDKMIYLGDFVPGLYDLDYIERLDTDRWKDEDNDYKAYEDVPNEEWLAFYQYDTRQTEQNNAVGPYGAAIYDTDVCRPQSILSYELVPVSYDYLAQDKPRAVAENILEWYDSESDNRDYFEVIVNGATRGVVTDLNIFRKKGSELDCVERQAVLNDPNARPFFNPISYENIGSFRGNHQVRRDGATVTVVDSAGFERSQFVVKRKYQPWGGTYYQPGTTILREPVEYTLDFGTGQPDNVTQVYYPEKAVLAFYLNLGQDSKELQEAASYLSEQAQQNYPIRTDPFGLSTSPDSVAQARGKLDHVLVWQIGYEPDVPAEQMHQTRQVRVTVVGVNAKNGIDYGHPCEVTWEVIGVPQSGALPYGCEWKLNSYTSTCP